MSETLEKQHPLPDFLALAVPLEIARIRARGGPTDTDHAACRQFVWIEGEEIPSDPEFDETSLPIRRHASVLGTKGDVILYGGPDQGQLVADLVRVIAVLAFQPGGIRVFKQHWRADV